MCKAWLASGLPEKKPWVHLGCDALLLADMSMHACMICMMPSTLWVSYVLSTGTCWLHATDCACCMPAADIVHVLETAEASRKAAGGADSRKKEAAAERAMKASRDQKTGRKAAEDALQEDASGQAVSSCLLLMHRVWPIQSTSQLEHSSAVFYQGGQNHLQSAIC